MRIGIIGAGFTGLGAAHKLLKLGHSVTIFEKDSSPGGLALGFKEKDWAWSLEKHYHHWFTNDTNILGLAKEIGYPVIVKRPKTSVYVDNFIYQFDSLFHVLKFPRLTLVERLRMTAVLGALRYDPFWRPLEKVRAADFLPQLLGKNPYEKLWEPQLISKFGPYAQDISLAWFWARIKKRTSSLAYPKGGFLQFAHFLVGEIEKSGGRVLFETEVIEIAGKRGKNIVKTKNEIFNFDAVIVTLPSVFFLKITPTLPVSYKKTLERLQGLGAINLILRLKKSFLKDGTYWLSVCDKKSPIMAIVEHTNLVDKKYYNNEHIVYLGNYFPPEHPYFKLSADEILIKYDPFLKMINPDYKEDLISYHLFKVPFAQPIIPINYSKTVPPFETPIKNVYLANIQQVYPWDRGTNYAVELGQKLADIVNKSNANF